MSRPSVHITEEPTTVEVEDTSLRLKVVSGIARLQDAVDLKGTAGTGKGWVRNASGAMEWTDLATQAELDAHAAAATAHGITRYDAGPIAVGPSVDTEVTLIEQTIPGGLLGVYGRLRCTFGGSFLNSSVSRTYTLRVYAGGTKILDVTSVAIAAAAMRRAFAGELNFANRNNAASNLVFGSVGLGAASSPTLGVGGALSGSGSGGSVPNTIASGVVAINTAVDWAFKVTLQLSFADAAFDIALDQVLLEVMS